jgi:predicted metal-dependent phosphoesterase TrpH
VEAGSTSEVGRADLHVHTTWSDGLGTPEQVVESAVRRGLDVIVVTDHDRFEGATAARQYSRARGYPLEVVGGMEITTSWGRHLLALFVAGPFHMYRPAGEVILEVAARGGLCIIPHPFTRLTLSFGRGAIEDLLRRGLPITGIERCNPTPAGRAAARYTSMLNSAWGLADVGGSDAHFPNRVGDAYTLFEGTTAEDLRLALICRRTVGCFGDGSVGAVSVPDYARQLTRSFVRSPLRKLQLAIRALRSRLRTSAFDSAPCFAEQAQNEPEGLRLGTVMPDSSALAEHGASREDC